MEFKEVLKIDKKAVLVSYITSFSTKLKLIESMKKVLAPSIKQGNIFLYILSSFLNRYDLENFPLQKGIKFFYLPVALEEVSIHVVHSFFSNRHKNQRWPGGTRVKLPPQIL